MLHYFFKEKKEREGEREGKERERERERDRQTDRQTEGEREREKRDKEYFVFPIHSYALHTYISTTVCLSFISLSQF